MGSMLPPTAPHGTTTLNPIAPLASSAWFVDRRVLNNTATTASLLINYFVSFTTALRTKAKVIYLAHFRLMIVSVLWQFASDVRLCNAMSQKGISKVLVDPTLVPIPPVLDNVSNSIRGPVSIV